MITEGISKAVADLRDAGCDADADRIESALTKAEAVAWREFSAWVRDMPTSAGMEHWVCVGHGNTHAEHLTTNVFKTRGRAEYEVAEWNHLFGRCDKPDILAFDTDGPPAVPVESLGRDAEPDEVAEYVEDYEYRGETEDGRDACYTPNERERLLIEDAIRGWEDRTTAAEPVASVPDGWQLVPVTPRLGMLDALSCAMFGDARLTFGDRREQFRRGYAAMLAESPQPSTNQEGAAP